MKKFLTLVGMTVALTGTMLAHGGGGGYTPPSNDRNDCTDCGDESDVTSEITICAGVRVPICVGVEDGSLEFPCLRRPLNSYFQHATSGWSDAATVNPSSSSDQQAGNTARIIADGDENDTFYIELVGVNGSVVNNGAFVRIRHANTPDQYSTGASNPPANTDESTDNADYMDVRMTYFVTPNGGTNESNPFFSNPTGVVNFASPATQKLVFPNTTPGNYLGTGRLTIWIGGRVETRAGQQRGQYTGAFKVKAFYAQ